MVEFIFHILYFMTYEMNEFDTKKVVACNIQNISKSRKHILFIVYTYIFEKDTIIQKTNEVRKDLCIRIGRTLE